jgi:hypothetical protein
MSIGETLGTISNIEVIQATHVATQTYGVCTQWWPHANRQNVIQTTHKIIETTSMSKQSLLVLWKTKPHSWCLSKKMCSTHIACTTTSTTTQRLEKKGNEDV